VESNLLRNQATKPQIEFNYTHCYLNQP